MQGAPRTPKRPKLQVVLPGWRRFALLAAFLLALFACIVIGVPEFYGLLSPETGSTPGRIAQPCGELIQAEPRSLVSDPVGGVRVNLPAGDWQVVDGFEGLHPLVVWREQVSRDVLWVQLLDRFPGRPRIEHGQMHGIVELERCREGSAWIASGYQMAYENSRVAIALRPTADGRWLYVRARTTGDVTRQAYLLAAVRTASISDED